VTGEKTAGALEVKERLCKHYLIFL